MTVNPQSSTRAAGSEQAQVLCVIPVRSILGHFPVVPVGASEKGTMPFDTQRESADFLGASGDKARTVAMDVDGGE